MFFMWYTVSRSEGEYGGDSDGLLGDIFFIFVLHIESGQYYTSYILQICSGFVHMYYHRPDNRPLQDTYLPKRAYTFQFFVNEMSLFFYTTGIVVE